MKWEYKKASEWVLRKQTWHVWFAWHPVRVITHRKTYIIWLEKVYRRGSSWATHGCFGWTWKYREINPKNKLTIK